MTGGVVNSPLARKLLEIWRNCWGVGGVLQNALTCSNVMSALGSDRLLHRRPLGGMISGEVDAPLEPAAEVPKLESGVGGGCVVDEADAVAVVVDCVMVTDVAVDVDWVAAAALVLVVDCVIAAVVVVDVDWEVEGALVPAVDCVVVDEVVVAVVVRVWLRVWRVVGSGGLVDLRPIATIKSWLTVKSSLRGVVKGARMPAASDSILSRINLDFIGLLLT